MAVGLNPGWQGLERGLQAENRADHRLGGTSYIARRLKEEVGVTVLEPDRPGFKSPSATG